MTLTDLTNILSLIADLAIGLGTVAVVAALGALVILHVADREPEATTWDEFHADDDPPNNHKGTRK